MTKRPIGRLSSAFCIRNETVATPALGGLHKNRRAGPQDDENI